MMKFNNLKTMKAVNESEISIHKILMKTYKFKIKIKKNMTFQKTSQILV